MMILNTFLEYTGSLVKQPQEVPNNLRKNGQTLYPYLPDPELVKAVNLAIALQRPLILEGEPGCGKTRLAEAVAYELGLDFFPVYVTSVTKAQDIKYSYDTLGRLRDVYLERAKRGEDGAIEADDPQKYVRLGPFGLAFESAKGAVILIDEIDKADRDFLNDILQLIEDRYFIIEEVAPRKKEPETEEEGKRVANPDKPLIIFITSNQERELPAPLLRRCLYHYIEFPNEKRLGEILQAHLPTTMESLSEEVANVINSAVTRFRQLREEMEIFENEEGKKVTTSELIDWFKVLLAHHTDGNEILKDEIEKELAGDNIPYPAVLIKSYAQYENYVLRKAQGDGE